MLVQLENAALAAPFEWVVVATTTTGAVAAALNPAIPEVRSANWEDLLLTIFELLWAGNGLGAQKSSSDELRTHLENPILGRSN